MTELVISVLTMAGGVYGTSAGAKLASRRRYAAFRNSLNDTELVPGRLLTLTAAAMAGAELIVAAGMTVATALMAAGLPGARAASTAALTCAIALTGVLAAGVTVVIRAGTRAVCACFGARATRPLGGSHLVRNLGLLALLTTGLIGTVAGHDEPTASGASVAIAAGLVVALLVTRLDDLILLFVPVQPPRAR